MASTRLIITRRGCPFCREALNVIDMVNPKLPIEKRIKIYDNYTWEEFGLAQHPIIAKLDKEGFNGYPFIFLDGYVVEPAQKEILKPFLEGFLRGEFLF